MIRADLKARVIAWAEARNFFGEGGATVEGQLAKLLEEASELVTDIVRGRDATDSVGDCLVVLTILERMGARVDVYSHAPSLRALSTVPPQNLSGAFAASVGDMIANHQSTSLTIDAIYGIANGLNIDPNHALSVALAEIEPRRGSWSGGVFVKEAT